MSANDDEQITENPTDRGMRWQGPEVAGQSMRLRQNDEPKDEETEPKTDQGDEPEVEGHNLRAS